MKKPTETFIYNGHEITQEHIRAKNKVVDFALRLWNKKQQIAESEKELQQMLIVAEKIYGAWFADRCKEIIASITDVMEKECW
jgi:hypothetical protein